MGDWYSAIYRACILASLIAFVIGIFTQAKTSFGAYVAGYSVLTLGVMMILMILFNGVLKYSNAASPMQTLSAIFMAAGPFMLIFGIISFILYLLIKYQSNIVSGNVAPGYGSFSNIIVMLLLLQVYIIYQNIKTEQFVNTGKISRLTSGLIYLFGTLTAICTVILYTILKYYSTDGFTRLL